VLIPNGGLPLQLHIAGGFSLDAVIHRDGRVETARIGGNALWAIVGALAVEFPSYAHAILGADFPIEFLDELRARGVDCTGVRQEKDRLGVRITHSYTSDGTRSHPANPEAVAALPEDVRSAFIDTTTMVDEILASLPAPADLPADTNGTAWHLGLLPILRFSELVAHIRSSGAEYLQSDTPARAEIRDSGLGALGNSLESLDVFLPSTSDTDVFLPGVAAAEIIRQFHKLGAPVVLLKMGQKGAIVSEKNKSSWHIPVFIEKQEIDPTGAGDVFAGVFAAEFIRSGSLVAAACSGAAVASLATRYHNPLAVAALDRQEIIRRTRFIEQNVQKI